MLLEKPTPDALLSAIAKHRGIALFTAPTSYRAMAPLAAAVDLSTPEQVRLRGEALPTATRKLWKHATGIEIIDGIGTTEMMHIFISHDDPQRAPARSASRFRATAA